MTARPDPDALRRQGVALMSSGRLAEAFDALLDAVQRAPADPAINFAFATLATRLQQPALAVGHLQRVLQVLPDSDAAHAALARALAALGRAGDGVALLERLLQRQPGSKLARLASGIVREQAADYAGAAADYEVALRAAPDDPILRYHRSFLRLRDGELGAGFADYEHRFDGGDVPRPSLGAPPWDGRRVGALRLVAEQGLGDVLHFCRFVPTAARRARRTTLAVPPSLVGLLARSLSVDVVPLERTGARIDAAAPLMSLPRLLGLAGESVDPANVPADYLRVDRQRVAAMAARLPATRGIRIGVAWAASSAHPTEASPYCRRSCPVEALAPLLDSPGNCFVSLQVGPRAKDAKAFVQLVDASGWIEDFDDTAALVAAIDLVVTVDTSIVHLAGSLGKPVLVMLPFSANWQWMHGDRTPWYPTARLVRQQRPGEWAGVVERVKAGVEEALEPRLA